MKRLLYLAIRLSTLSRFNFFANDVKYFVINLYLVMTTLILDTYDYTPSSFANRVLIWFVYTHKQVLYNL